MKKKKIKFKKESISKLNLKIWKPGGCDTDDDTWSDPSACTVKSQTC